MDQILMELPLFIGPEEGISKREFPIVQPFQVIYNSNLGLIQQKVGQQNIALLEKVYEYGSTMGHAMSGVGLGSEYAQDFLAFLQEVIKEKDTILEIGCGHGYLMKLLKDIGYSCIGIEPGKCFRQFWDSYGVDVVRGFYPNIDVANNYDAIISYGVLEHVLDPVQLLRDMRGDLGGDGLIIAAVPDCSKELEEGNPSILMHEHISYFNETSLETVFDAAGIRVVSIRKSRFGRMLYVVGKPGINTSDPAIVCHSHIGYPGKALRYREKAAKSIAEYALKKDISKAVFYCPIRGINILPWGYDYTFADDSLTYIGKYIPPFKSKILSSEQIDWKLIEDCWILSDTFFEKIEHKLRRLNYCGKIHRVGDLV